MPAPWPSPLFVVPFPRNSDFVGREQELARLHEALGGATDPAGITPAGLTSMGGIGKSQLAVEYYYRYVAAYPGGVSSGSTPPNRCGRAWQLWESDSGGQMEVGTEHQQFVGLRRFIVRL